MIRLRARFCKGLLALAALLAVLSIQRPRSSTAKEPIAELMEKAAANFEELMAAESSTYHEAFIAYGRRRGRSPPPGFAAWFAMANATAAVVVEAFWDQIYEDLAPFWRLSPETVRSRAAGLAGPRINHLVVKNNQARGDCEEQNSNCHALLSMIQSLAYALPDMDIPFNSHISPRVIIPWEVMADLPTSESATPAEWDTRTPVPLQVQAACPPDSAARTFDWHAAETGHTRPNATLAERHTLHGFVSDVRLAKDVCGQPDLLHLHGALIAPVSQHTTEQLVPLFSSGVIPGVSREIVIPAPLNMRDDEDYWTDVSDLPWNAKKNKVFWRGSNTGGDHNSANWPAFHRHRFVAVANRSAAVALSDAVPSGSDCLSAQVDVGFDVFECADVQYAYTTSCSYLDPHFTTVPTVNLSAALQHRYLIDVDGNGFSGRFPALMATNSVPIKSTIFQEWFGDRLVPWKHYIPMDARYGDFWTLALYFLGKCDQSSNGAHDDEGRAVAEAGKAWAGRVLRKDDMRLFLFRLLLEFARINHDDRDRLGEVEPPTK